MADKDAPEIAHLTHLLNTPQDRGIPYITAERIATTIDDLVQRRIREASASFGLLVRTENFCDAEDT